MNPFGLLQIKTQSDQEVGAPRSILRPAGTLLREPWGRLDRSIPSPPELRLPFSSAAAYGRVPLVAAVWSPVSMMSSRRYCRVSSGAGVSVMDVGADLGVSWCRGCDGGGVHVPVTGGVQGRDPVSWAQGVTAASRGGGLGSEPSCLTLPRLLAAAPHLCTSCFRLTHTWLAEPLLWNYLSMSEVGL